MSEEKEGWSQWRDGDNLHEQRPAPNNIGGYARTTHFGHFSRSSEIFRKLYREKMEEAFKESLFYDLLIGK